MGGSVGGSTLVLRLEAYLTFKPMRVWLTVFPRNRCVFHLRSHLTTVALSLIVSGLAFSASCTWAIDEFGDLKRIAELPIGERAVSNAFRIGRADACELVPKGEPLEISNFTSYLTQQDRRRKQRPIPSSRRDLFHVGLEFNSSDRADLPLLSRNQIVDYVDEHYLAIQARVRRDLLDRELYYHHRPIAVTANYRGSRVSQNFEPIVSNTVKDFHGLGLFVPEDIRLLKPEHLRTLVLIFRTPLLRAGREDESYEFVMVRGRTDRDKQLTSHVFVTTEGRSILHYLSSADRPTSPSKTTILGQIAVTKYDSSGVYPRESATRTYRLASRSKFEIEDLQNYCDEQDLAGGFERNVTQVLDAIIDRKIASASRF